MITPKSRANESPQKIVFTLGKIKTKQRGPSVDLNIIKLKQSCQHIIDKIKIWWGWLGLNQRPTGYEPAALTAELHPHQRQLYPK